VFGLKKKKVSDPQYERQGYRIFQQALNADAVRNATEAIKNEVFPHQGPLLRHPTGRTEEHRFLGKHIANQLLNPHRAETLPLTSAALVDLVCSPELRGCLNLLDGQDEYTIHQVILFFVGPAMDIHVDGWFFDTTPHGYAHTVWIPLEDLTIDNGPICVYPTPRARYVDPTELGLNDLFSARDDDSLTRYHAYQNAIIERCRRSQSAVVAPQIKRGDFVVWTSLTPHGSFRAREGTSRLSMQVLIRPSSYDWGRFQDIEVDKKPRQEKGTPIRPGWRLFL
jgi:ectoine hydroxylase-related dioxygenase (phytanoyl-CoA dioxygenase family)